MPNESTLAAHYRADETRLYNLYGLTPTERYVRVGETDIHVVSLPGSGTPIVLLHGAASVTAAAIPLIPAFGGAPVIAIDWPGHGLSGAYPFTRHTDVRALAVTIIDAVADAFDLTTFNIVAHSLGGQFALYYCLVRAERVRKLVLLGAPGAAFGELTAAGGFQLLGIPLIGSLILRRPVSLEQYGKNSALTLGKGTVDPWPPELVSVGWYASRRAAFHSTLPRLFRAIAGPRGVRRGIAVTIEEVRGIGIPTLFVWGDTDVFLSPAGGRAWTDAMPDATVVELRAGHAPWLNQPEESAAAVRDFLLPPAPGRR